MRSMRRSGDHAIPLMTVRPWPKADVLSSEPCSGDVCLKSLTNIYFKLGESTANSSCGRRYTTFIGYGNDGSKELHMQLPEASDPVTFV